MKKCAVCKMEKEVNQFTRSTNYKDGLNRLCNICRNAARRKLHKKDPRLNMISCAKQRAIRKNLPFTITKNDIVIPEFCPALGIKLEVSSGGSSDNSPTIDRIEPSKGYIPSNIIVVSHRANMLKGDATLDEIRAVIKYLKENGGE